MFFDRCYQVITVVVNYNRPFLFFQLPNDMENYMMYHIMGSVAQIRIKPGCMPSKFECQPDRKRASSTSERLYIIKKQKMMVHEECEKQLEESNKVTERLSNNEIASGSSGMKSRPLLICMLIDCFIYSVITSMF